MSFSKNYCNVAFDVRSLSRRHLSASSRRGGRRSAEFEPLKNDEETESSNPHAVVQYCSYSSTSVVSVDEDKV